MVDLDRRREVLVVILKVVRFAERGIDGRCVRSAMGVSVVMVSHCDGALLLPLLLLLWFE